MFTSKKRFLFFLLLLPHLIKAQTISSNIFKEQGVDGSITIYDYKHDKWYFTDKKDAYRKTLPASTFKIINSLIALDCKVIADTNTIVKWNGQENRFKETLIPAWNKDTNMKEAFKNSTIWFYVRLAGMIGLNNYYRYLRLANYGNGKISSGVNGDFWNYGDFGISPVGQIRFLKALYEEKVPFSKSSVHTVKSMMVLEKTPDYELYGKTGWSYDVFDNGWWVGYIKKEDNVYFFATRITKDLNTPDDGFAAKRMEITKRLFSKLGLVRLN